MTTLRISTDTNLRNQDLTGVTRIEFTAEVVATLTLDFKQVSDQLAPNLVVDGGNAVTYINIYGGSVDLSAWRFTNWLPNSYLKSFTTPGGDTLIGSTVIDEIYVGPGGNADAGSGDDRLIVSGGIAQAGPGDDFVELGRDGEGFVDGGAGNDGLRFDMRFYEGDLDFDFRDGGVNLPLFADWTLSNFEWIGITAGVGDDHMSGGNGNDYLNGGEGHDDISGRSGDDYLNGWSGRDRLSGGSGDDTLQGGGGSDVLIGGSGNDAFYFYRIGRAADQIRDFGFNGDDDIIQILPSSVGMEAGPFDASELQVDAVADALTSQVRFVYDSSTGRLSFDNDGNGSSAAILLAVLPKGLVLSVADFEIV